MFPETSFEVLFGNEFFIRDERKAEIIVRAIQLLISSHYLNHDSIHWPAPFIIAF